MKHLISFLFITQVLGTFTVLPKNYSMEATSLSGKQYVDYTVTATLPVSVFILNEFGYSRFSGGQDFDYNHDCSRVSITSINVSCTFYTQTNAQTMSTKVFFVIKNDNTVPVNASYTLKSVSYTHLTLPTKRIV